MRGEKDEEMGNVAWRYKQNIGGVCGLEIWKYVMIGGIVAVI